MPRDPRVVPARRDYTGLRADTPSACGRTRTANRDAKHIRLKGRGACTCDPLELRGTLAGVRRTLQFDRLRVRSESPSPYPLPLRGRGVLGCTMHSNSLSLLTTGRARERMCVDADECCVAFVPPGCPEATGFIRTSSRPAPDDRSSAS